MTNDWWAVQGDAPFWGEAGEYLYHGTSIGSELLIAGEASPVFVNRIGLLVSGAAHDALTRDLGWPAECWELCRSVVVVDVDWRQWWGRDECPIDAPNSRAELLLRGRLYPRRQAGRDVKVYLHRPRERCEIGVYWPRKRKRPYESTYKFVGDAPSGLTAWGEISHDNDTENHVLIDDKARADIEGLCERFGEVGWLGWTPVTRDDGRRERDPWE